MARVVTLSRSRYGRGFAHVGVLGHGKRYALNEDRRSLSTRAG